MTGQPRESDAGVTPAALTGAGQVDPAVMAGEATRGSETKGQKRKYKDTRSRADRGRLTGRPVGKPKGKTKLSMFVVREALRRSGGIQSDAIKLVYEKTGVRVAPSTMCTYVQRYPELQEAMQQSVDLLLDKAEGNLRSRVMENDWHATRYLLSTKGRSRGYVTKTEVTTPADQPLQVQTHVKWEDVPQQQLRDVHEVLREAILAAKRVEIGAAAPVATPKAA